MSTQSEAAREAAKTTGERLSAIERWSRWTAIATTAAAVFLAGIAGGVGYVTYDYVRVKHAAIKATEEFNRTQALEAAQRDADLLARQRARGLVRP